MLRYQNVGEDMAYLFRDPWIALPSAIIPSLRNHIVGAEQGKRWAEAESRIDHLTGLWNKRAFDEIRTREVGTAFRREEPLTLAVIDLDYFKRLNNTRGHLEGDNALRTVGDVLKYPIRPSDTAYRIGGDEFSLILPGTGLEGGWTAAMNYRTHLNDILAPYEVTVSVGLSAYEPEYDPVRGRTPNLFDAGVHSTRLYNNADKALYGAKKTRRQPDRVGICAYRDGELVLVG